MKISLLPNVKISKHKAKSIITQHASFRNNPNYTVINELEMGDYFGEISWLTNLSVTASIHTVSKTICGRLNKEALAEYLKYNDSKIKMYKRMYKYNDPFFQTLIKWVKNIPFFRGISHSSIKTLIFKMKRVKINAGTTIINFKEYSNCFFLHSGVINVNIIDEKTNFKYQFQHLKEGSSFNITNWILKQYSLFEFVSETDWVLMQLEYKDLK